MQSEDTGVRGPLAGKVVLDLSRALAGPHAGMMLGDMGARVIKVEAPGTGDDSRAWGPPFVGSEAERDSTYFYSCNRNKESIELNFKDDDDMAVMKSLVEEADVLIENFRPGVLDRLGLSVGELHELNPGLVILSITGFGHDGPESSRPGYDQIAQGEAGLMSLTGPSADQPTRVGVPIGDLLAGIYGAYGAAAALVEREQTGKGSVVRTSLLSALIGVHAFQGTRYTIGGQVPEAIGNHHPSIAPYGAFAAADKVVQIAVGNQRQWASLCDVLKLDPEDSRFSTNGDRVTNRPALIEEIERRLAARPAAEWLAAFGPAGIPAGAVRNLAEVYEWDQAKSQGATVSVLHPTEGLVDLPGPAIRMEDADGGSLLRSSHSVPPSLGEHTQSIRGWLQERSKVSADQM